MKRKPIVTTSGSLDDFISGAKDEKTYVKQEQRKPARMEEETDLDALRRQTYYITELYIKAIKHMAFYEHMDKSQIVREALEQYVPKQYIKMAIKE